MKKILAYLLMVGVLSGWALAWDGPRTVAYVDRVTSGSLAVTNSHQDAAYELKHVSFTIPTADLTNVFSIAHTVRYKLPDIQTTIVTTNSQLSSDADGYIETNTFWYAQGTTEITNSFTVATTNQSTVQFYDTDDFPKGWSWEYEDIQTFSFTETNAFTLIRVYDAYSRP